VVTENEWLRLPINQNILAASPYFVVHTLHRAHQIAQNILAASPYFVVHTVHRAHQTARPLPFPAPNIQHQSQCDPGANDRSENNINVLYNIVDLEHPFPILSADHIAPEMTALIHDTFLLPLLDESTCHVPL
jgi:hypothetical protein